MRDESLLLGKPTLRDINAALERLMEQARQRRHRYRVQQRSRAAATITKSQEIAEVLCLWQAALPIVFSDKKLPHGTRTRIIGWVARQHGVSRPQFYKLLKSVDPTVNWPIPAAVAESRRTATRVTVGAISLSNSAHFAASA